MLLTKFFLLCFTSERYVNLKKTYNLAFHNPHIFFYLHKSSVLDTNSYYISSSEIAINATRTVQVSY